MARLAGLPTRVAVGFQLPSGGGATVRVQGMHAEGWPEVAFAGFGWVPFEPTPREASAPPQQTNLPTPAAPSLSSGAGPRHSPAGAGGAAPLTPGPGGRRIP